MQATVDPKIAKWWFRLHPTTRKQVIADVAGSFRKRDNPYAIYTADPAGFGVNVLGEAYTDGVIEMMESVRDYPVTVVQSANAVGKTHAAARLAVWFYKAFDDAQVYTAAAPPEDNLKRLLWGEIGSIVIGHPELFKDDKVTYLNIGRDTQDREKPSFITGVVIPSSGTPAEREAKFSGKHAPAILFAIDEGDAVPEEVYKGIESCLSGGNGRLLVMFNPRMESGPVYRMVRDNLANVVRLRAFDHPNVKTGEEKIKGAVTREKTVQRINLWSRPLAGDEKPDHECFEVPDFLIDATALAPNGQYRYPPLPAGWRKITNPALSYMVLGDYPAQAETQLISKTWIADARARWDAYVAMNGEKPPEGTRPIMGQDVAEYGVDKNVSLFRWGGWVERPESWQGVDTLVTTDKAVERYQRRKALKALVDGTGVGSGVAPGMSRKGCFATSVKVASSPTYKVEEGEFALLRDQLWWSCREWLRTDPGAMLPPNEELVEELSIPTYINKGGKIRVMDKETMRALLGRSPDWADALCLTFAPDDPAQALLNYYKEKAAQNATST